MTDRDCTRQQPRPLSRIWCWGKRIEDLLLAGLLLVMVILAVLLIVLRNVFDSGLVWGDELLRILVLWLCLVGSIAGSRDDNHLSIDVASRFLPTHLQALSRILTNLFTALVCGSIAWFSWKFVRIEAEFGSEILGQWPAWTAQAILPLGFGIMAYRYLLHALRKAGQLIQSRRPT